MKVIFLDFDGPIIPIMSHVPTARGVAEKAWPSCVAALNRVIETTGAKIVLSTSWRIGRWNDLPAMLRQWGVVGDVIGATPYYRSKIRGAEIRAWLKKNPVDAFVILDDDDDMGRLKKYLIQTPFETGLTEELASRAIDMLTVF